MPMVLNYNFVICPVLIILLATGIFATGCTSTQTPAQNSSPTATTQPVTATTAPRTVVTTSVPTTVQTTIVSTNAVQVSEGINVTINSAVKKTNIGIYNNKPGNIFLVLDITIKNNNKNNDFKYTDSSFLIGDKTNQNRRSAITSQVAGGLNSPLSSGTIPLKSTKTGQIVFGVMDTSNANLYRLFIDDPTGTVLTSIDNIAVT
jgi:hypothetical protein